VTISSRFRPYDIPKYSLTGDLLSFLKCRMQYRFFNKGSLPPSTPVQMWFGEFIHGVMEEGFLKYRKDKDEGTLKLPWDFKTVQEISMGVAKRLEKKGLKPYLRLFVMDDDPKKYEQGLANRRAYLSLFTWATHLFPLIDTNEVKLEDVRPMKDPSVSRSDYYAVTGIADVITSINLNDVKADNRVMQYLMVNPDIEKFFENYTEFEIIVDYKGTMRPKTNDPEWKYHEWQLNTYMWLRINQLKAQGIDHPVIAGVLLYLNELCPTPGYEGDLLAAIESGTTDVGPSAVALRALKENLSPTDRYKRDRCIRIVPYDEENINNSLKEFDQVVLDIEKCVQSEIKDSSDVMKHWCYCKDTFQKERCTACDAQFFCENIKNQCFPPLVP